MAVGDALPVWLYFYLTGCIFSLWAIGIGQLGEFLAVDSNPWWITFLSWFSGESAEFWTFNARYYSAGHRGAVLLYQSGLLEPDGGTLADFYSGTWTGTYPDVYLWTQGEYALDSGNGADCAGLSILWSLMGYFSLLANNSDCGWTLSSGQGI